MTGHQRAELALAIDTSGKWWRGETFDDLAEYLRGLTEEGYPAEVVRESVCAQCGGRVFGVRGDQDEGVARRTCRACRAKWFIGDCEAFWSDAEPRTVKCPCGSLDFNVAVAYSLRQGGEVRWLTVGQRCVRCGVLGSYVDWKIDYEPSKHLLDRA